MKRIISILSLILIVSVIFAQSSKTVLTIGAGDVRYPKKTDGDSFLKFVYSKSQTLTKIDSLIRVVVPTLTWSSSNYIYSLKKDSVALPSTLLNGLLGAWNLNQNSNTLTDALGLHSMTNSGGVVNQTGKIGQAVLFDTNSDYVSTPNSPTLILPGNAFTISLWFKLTTLPSTGARDYYLFSAFNDASSSPAYSIFLTSINQITCRCRNTIPSIISQTSNSTGLLSTGTWIHIVFVNYGVGIASKIYLNGTAIATADSQFAGTLTVPNGACFIGSKNSFENNAIDGLIDDVNYWNRAITNTEIARLYKLGTGNPYPYLP